MSFSFSLLKSIPIALIKGGARNNQILYLDLAPTIIFTAPFILGDGETFRLIPTNDKRNRDTLFIAGASGSGKTRFAMDFIKFYLFRNPNNEAIIFTPDPQDESIIPFADNPRLDIVDILSKNEIDQYK